MASSEQTWFEKMNAALSNVERTPEGLIKTESYCAAIAQIPGIYEALFSMIPMAVSTLSEDINNGVLRVRQAAQKLGSSGETLQGMCDALVQSPGSEACRADNTSGIRCLLWLNRATSFICHLIKYILAGKEPHVAANDAYVEYLQPYHGYMLGTLVQTIMYGAPPKEKMFDLLKLESEDAALAQMGDFVRMLEPITVDVLAHLERLQCNWPDKA